MKITFTAPDRYGGEPWLCRLPIDDEEARLDILLYRARKEALKAFRIHAKAEDVELEKTADLNEMTWVIEP